MDVQSLKTYAERIQRLVDERKGLASDIRDLYAEANGNGYDKKALREAIRLHGISAPERETHRELVQLYLAGLE